MQVLIVAGWYPSKFNLKSGDFVMYQAQALQKAGIDVAVIFAYLSAHLITRPKDILHKYSYNVENGIPTFRLSGFFLPKSNGLFLNWWARRFESLFLKYLEKFGKPDVLHAQTFLGGLVAYRISKKYNIPYLVTEHQSPILTDDIPKWKLPMMKKVYDNAAVTMAVSRALKVKMKSIFTEKPVAVVPNFINTRKFNIASKAHSGFNFIAIGDLIPSKSYDLLINAYKRFLENCEVQSKLTIVGDGPELANLSSLVDAHSIETKVRFAGRCSQEEVADHLKQSDVLVVSSSVETFGIVIIEAMGTGLPVISTRCFGPLDIVTDSTGILAPVGNIEAMKDAMIHVFQHIDKYDKKQIRQHILDNFSEEVVVDKLQKIYTSV